jgi:hypothetical protein
MKRDEPAGTGSPQHPTPRILALRHDAQSRRWLRGNSLQLGRVGEGSALLER